jgi:short-subunit dehydrogenase
LILVARDQARIAALAARIESETGRPVTPFVADLNDKTDLAKVEAVLREDPTITMLVNNAGVASVAPLLEADVEKMEDIITLKSPRSPASPTRPRRRSSRAARGRSSTSARSSASRPETLNGVYGASKSYVLALSHSLQHELADKGVRVQEVLPGATATDV